jgi:hypothetical protein
MDCYSFVVIPFVNNLKFLCPLKLRLWSLVMELWFKVFFLVRP